MTTSNDSSTLDTTPTIPSSAEISITERLFHEVDTRKVIQLPYEFVSVQGDKALDALQGQISCDLKELKTGQISYGTANTPKGRMYALFRITPWKNGYLICLDKGMGELFEQTINKYLVFFRCTLTRESDLESHLTGSSESTLQGEVLTLATPSQALKEVWCTHRTLPSEFAEQVWGQWQSVLGIPMLTPSTSEHFILQHLNLQHLKLEDHAAVSFSKGCYTGQEIIARMKYLGKLKKKMYLIQAQLPDLATLTAGSDLFSSESKKVGEVVRWHSDSEMAVGLATIDISAAEKEHRVFAEDSNKQSSYELSVFKLKYSSE